MGISLPRETSPAPRGFSPDIFSDCNDDIYGFRKMTLNDMDFVEIPETVSPPQTKEEFLIDEGRLVANAIGKSKKRKVVKIDEDELLALQTYCIALKKLKPELYSEIMSLINEDKVKLIRSYLL